MLPIALAQWLSKNKLIIELILAGLVIVAVSMKYSGIEGSDMILLISMLLLATFYFFSAYLFPEISSILGIIATKVIAISSSICVIGMLFTILKWHGSENMLLIGASSLFIAGIILLITGIKSWNNKFLPLLARVIVLGSISASTLMSLMKQSGKI